MAKTGLLIGGAVGVLALVGLAVHSQSKTTETKPAITPGQVPDQLSSDPVQALAQLVAALGNPNQTLQQKTMPSGRVYDAALWRPSTSSQLPGALIVTAAIPAPVFYAITWNTTGQIRTLASVLPDEVAKADVMKIQQSI